MEIYGSFAEIKDCVGFELIKRLSIINSQMNNSNFKAFFKFSNGEKDADIVTLNERFTQDFVENVMSDCLPERIYVCGPPQFNRDIPEFALNCGFSKDRIIIV